MNRSNLAVFFVLACVFSWAYWIPLALFAPRVSHFPGLLGPMLAAVVVAGVTAGRPGLRDLVGRMLRWRVGLRWYAVTIVPAAVSMVSLAILAVFGGEFPPLEAFYEMPGLPAIGLLGVFVLVFVVNGYGEEVGWRGLAWPSLRKRYSMAGAALALAVPWAVWHIPTFWLYTGLRGFQPAMIAGWLIGLFAGAVVLGWLYENARASLLLVALFHAFLNMASATRATAAVAAAVSAVVILWAVLILRAQSRSP